VTLSQQSVNVFPLQSFHVPTIYVCVQLQSEHYNEVKITTK